jgi:hypothetical protein
MSRKKTLASKNKRGYGGGMPENTKLNRVNTYLTDEEKRLLELLATRSRRSVSSFLKILVLEAAARDGLFPEAYAYDGEEPPHA